MNTLRTRAVVVGLVGLLAMLAVSGLAEAQMTAATAEVVRVAGRVDVMQKGQTAWAATSLGARLREGDQIRALAGGSADLNLPDGSTVLLAENTRFAVTKLDYDAANRDREISLHLVAGKVRAQVQQAGATLVRARQSNFNISTPTGVAAVRGTILIMAHNPATQETLAFVFPSPGQAISAARATFATPGGQVTLTGGNFVRQVGTSAPGAPTPITSLPPAVQAALTTAQNTSTANSNELTVINVVLPSYQEIQNTISTPPIDTTTTTGTSGLTTGACPNCGQDMNSNSSTTPPPGPSCATPPCPPVPAGSRR